jgi:LysM repeat protein
MTDTGAPTSPQVPAGDPGRRSARRRDADAVLEVCPFLAADGGSWRSAYAAREHRCHALHPAAVLAIDKQRQLCLLAAHSGCATYLAAREVNAAAVPATPGDEGAALWSATASTPLVLEPARRMGALPGASAKSGGQALLVGLMVLAFLVLVIARTQSPAASGGATPGPSAGVAVASASPAASRPQATGSPLASQVPDASSGLTPDPSPAATSAPTARTTPKPSTSVARQRYRVKAGDTLSSIAVRFGTSVRALVALNKIADPRLIRVGQVLVIP